MKKKKQHGKRSKSEELTSKKFSLNIYEAILIIVSQTIGPFSDSSVASVSERPFTTSAV